MLRSLHFNRYIAASFGLHVVVFSALYILLLATAKETPLPIPVNIVNLPKDVVKKLPSLEQKPKPTTPPTLQPNKLTPLESTSPSARSERSPRVSVPATIPRHGKETGEEKAGTEKKGLVGSSEKGKGPLPFLSQNDIDELAQKGFPKWKLNNEPLSELTVGFKYYGYTSRLFAKANSVMKYPKLAAITGLQGDVYIYLDILKDGSIGSVDVVKSSGYKILDDEVLRTLREAAPYEPLPDDWNTDHYMIPLIGMFRIYHKEIR